MEKNKKANKNSKDEKAKHSNIIKIMSITLLSCILVTSIIYIIYDNLNRNKDKGAIEEIQEYIDQTSTDEDNEVKERIEKIKKLQEDNSDIKGWINVKDTKINYPILQGADNEYYLNHNYKKEKSEYGSIYLKDKSKIDDNNSNLILYGHNMKDGEMFNNLLNYTDKSYYDEHKDITITTQNEERKYQVIAVFKSRIFYQNEKNVFRYYNYINLEDENKYNEFIDNVNKIKLYDTELAANYGEQLITMITCEYSQENGRMIVVAKKIQ